MIEPMRTDLAEAERRPSAAEQLAARVAGHMPMPSPAVHTAHRRLKLEEPRDVRLDSATAVAHGRPDALGSADIMMQDMPR
jgi:hypothetical protein